MVKGALLSLIVILVMAGSAVGEEKRHAVKEHIDLTLVNKRGTSKFHHRGTAKGTANGTVRSSMVITHSVVMRGTVTISTAQGSVRIKVDGRARSLGTRAPFDGKAVMTGGTGKYAGATGTGKFAGVVNRSTWHVTLDATGSYHY